MELLEVKSSLNRAVIGQAMVVCGQRDSALEWVCQQEDITIEVVAGVRGKDASATTAKH